MPVMTEGSYLIVDLPAIGLPLWLIFLHLPMIEHHTSPIASVDHAGQEGPGHRRI